MDITPSASKKPHPWEEPQAPRAPKMDWFFKVGLTAPDVGTNPALWPFRWIYGGRALRRLKSVAQGSRRILDIRCGSGWLLWEMAKVAPQAQLLGLDTRLRPLIWGRRRVVPRRVFGLSSLLPEGRKGGGFSFFLPNHQIILQEERIMKTQTKTRTIPKTPFFAAFSVGAVLFSAHAGGGFATGNQANP